MSLRIIIGAVFAVVAWAESKEAISAQHLRLGIEAQQSGKAQLAIEEFRKSVEADPGRAEAHARLGMVYQSVGMLPQAAAALEQALKADPNLPDVGILLAFTYQSMGRNQDAEGERVIVTRLSPFFNAERFAAQFGTQAARDHILEGLKKAGFR